MTRFGYPASAAAPAAPAGPVTESGEYVPFIGIVSGIASSPPAQPHTAHWMRIGEIVTVTGWVEGTPLQVGLMCQFTVDLPVVPTVQFVEADRLSGVTSAIDTTTRTSTSCPVIARTAGNARQAEFYYVPTATNRMNFQYSFMYSLT